MSAYWIGLLTLPAIGLAWLGIVTFLGLLAKATVALPGVAQRLTPDTDERTRSAYGAIVYSARRCWWLGFGEVGLAVVVGQGSRDRSEAMDRLRVRPKPTLNPKFRKADGA